MKQVKSVTFKAWLNGEPRQFKIKGKAARTLCALTKRGVGGITALELSKTWAVRLSEYIRILRHDYSLDIPIHREEHDDEGGWHGRYVLITPVEILEIE